MINMVNEMRIETNRLVIRPYIESDLLGSFEQRQDKELFKYMDMDIMSFEEYKGLFKWAINSYNTGFDDDFNYPFAVCLKESGKIIGWCGVGILDCFYPEKEIYYLIGRDYWGKGYATEAMTSLIHYCFKTIGLQRIIALAKSENIASIKVIQKLGFKLEHLVSGLPEEFNFYNGVPYYSLTKEEYLHKI
jgi:[ribosomal protein S5]-alanine N-acetyltransferase